MKRSDLELGMDRAITRRDFVSGVAVAITSSSLVGPVAFSRSAQAERAAAAGESGLEQDALRDGARWDNLGPEANTGELYDLVVVGGGLSGLSAAYLFRKEVGPNARILVLDNCDDFGGHATRNEFRSGGRTLLINGGAINIEDLSAYDEPSQALISDLGIDVGRYSEYHDTELYPSRGLRGGVFFDEETSGVDRLVRTMIPATAPGSGAEDIVTARFDYAQLDRDGAPVRIRLNSTAVHVRHVGNDVNRQPESRAR